MDLKKLNILRGSVRTQATNSCKTGTRLLREKPVDKTAMSILREGLIDLQKELAEFNEKIFHLVELEEFEAESEKATEYKTKISDIIYSINAAIANCDQGVANSSASTTTSERQVHAKLPQLIISKFDGDPLKWQEFWDSFESMIHDHDTMKSVVKFNYLLSFLTGEAKRVLDGVAVTNSNYEEAIKLLKERFGKEDNIIFAHLNSLFSLPASDGKTGDLRKIYDECEKHIRCLDVFGTLTLDQIFAPLILSKLPQDLRVNLHRKNGSQQWQLASLRKSLKEEVEAREMGEREFCSKTSEKTSQRQIPSRSTNWRSTTETLVAQSNYRKPYCVFCNEEHYSDECTKYRDLDSRRQKLRDRCFKCTRSNHHADKCRTSFPCYYCGKRNHHRSLCPTKFGSKKSESPKQSGRETSTEVMNVSISQRVEERAEETLVQTARTEVMNPDHHTSQKSSVRLILDTGSQRSYVTERIARKLNLEYKGYEDMTISVFGASKGRYMKCQIAQLKIFFRDGSNSVITVSVVPIISCTVERVTLNTHEWPALQGLSFADTVSDASTGSPIDLLIGVNYYYEFVLERRINLADGLVALDTRFGWIPAGRVKASNSNNMAHSLLALSSDGCGTEECFSLERFWTLESIGVKESGTITDDDLALQHFRDNVRWFDGRYEVSWPWRDAIPELPNNYKLCYGRLKSLIQRLLESPKLLKQYDDTINEQLYKGIIEKAPINEENVKLHYMPHHCILKPGKSTTKLRVVYDASSKSSKKSSSLNDCLLRGPVLLEDLAGILIRFRLHTVAVGCDIEKAFLQVGLREQDREVTRFLWLKDLNELATKENIETFRFCRVPFGVVSSPFLLSATVSHHLKQSKSKFAEQILRNIYVDNIIVGKTSTDEAMEFYYEVKEIMKKASMNLREWTSNSIEFLRRIPSEDVTSDKEVSILGLKWNTISDTIHLGELSISSGIKNTKRTVLQHTSSIFDPLGLFSPVVIKAKMLMQNLWTLKLSWEDSLPSDLQELWMALSSELTSIHKVKIPRMILPVEMNELELHCFSDASAKAYGAVIYLVVRLRDLSVSNIMIAKTRVAPVSIVTIPRLELMGALVGARILNYSTDALDIQVSRRVLWIDSKCVLHWIHNADKKMPVFVENRLKELRSVIDLEFRYVPSTENPADLLSRGTSVRELKESSLWWNGPDWLIQDEERWPPKWSKNENPHDFNLFDNVNFDKISTFIGLVNATPVVSPFELQMERYSSLQRLLRVTAWALRFVGRGRKNCLLVLEASELADACRRWEIFVQASHFAEEIKQIKNQRKTSLVQQLGLFLDKDILRCGGRIDKSKLPYGAKHPILLPKDSHFSSLIVQDTHQSSFHVGTRQTLSLIRLKYWIPHGRSTVQKVIKKCLICRKFNGGPYLMPPPPPLPVSRVTEDTPFSCTGIDHFGPLYVKNKDLTENQQKVWVCLFTCAVVRAVHLEVVTDLSAEGVLMAIRRLAARRGLPKMMISDNAKGFKLASRVLSSSWEHSIIDPSVQNYSAANGMEWKFIVELAPWMGGFYERLVGSVKRSLRKAIGRASISLIQLQTFIVEVEAVVNSRPLIYMENELDDHQSLTPAHFLHASARIAFADLPDATDPEFKPREDSASALIQAWRKGQKLLDQFWSSWRGDYLLGLREKQRLEKQKRGSSGQPQVGDIVIIGEKQLPRGQWRMGKIEELLISDDGHVRSAVVSLSTGKKFRRAVTMLYPIEFSRSEAGLSQVSSSTEDPRKEDPRNETPRKSTRSAAIKAKRSIQELLRRECHET